MRTLALSIAFISCCIFVNSQLLIKNNFSKEYKVAIAFFDTGSRFSGWISKGWMTIAPGETIQAFYTNPREKYIYYFAISASDSLGGYKNILVNPVADFTIKHAIMTTTKEENPNYEWLPFREIRRGTLTKFKKELLITLGD